jgi:mannose/fructose/N-acetylgalactosamine-specific phosphotransferase system component IID
VISEEKEELNEKDQVKYRLIIVKNSQKKIKELTIKYKLYPLLHKNYWNFEELNVELKRHGQYTNTEIYFIRMNWNGSGYYPICSTKLKIDDKFFELDINKENVKEIVLGLLKELKDYLENSECENAIKYFPE